VAIDARIQDDAHDALVAEALRLAPLRGEEGVSDRVISLGPPWIAPRRAPLCERARHLVVGENVYFPELDDWLTVASVELLPAKRNETSETPERVRLRFARWIMNAFVVHPDQWMEIAR
jgi:hypothetical protein